MINREVRVELFERLGNISHQALSKRILRIKEKFGPMSTDEAAYIIAHQAGLDLSKHLPLELLDRIRSLIPREIKENIVLTTQMNKKAGKRKLKISYPLVKNTLINKANSLGDNEFPKIFIIENSIRNLIRLRLSRITKTWWPTLIPEDVLKNVNRIIKKEAYYPYREKRGSEPLLYCNFDDLKKIIIAPDNFVHFKEIILDSEWFRVRMEDVYIARNNLAHSIPLSKDDIARINVFYNDWARVLETAKIA